MTIAELSLDRPHAATNGKFETTIANLVHDVRQPLSAIEAIAYFLDMRLSAEQAEVHTYLRKVQELVAEANLYLSEAVAGNCKSLPAYK